MLSFLKFITVLELCTGLSPFVGTQMYLGVKGHDNTITPK